VHLDGTHSQWQVELLCNGSKLRLGLGETKRGGRGGMGVGRWWEGSAWTVCTAVLWGRLYGRQSGRLTYQSSDCGLFNHWTGWYSIMRPSSVFTLHPPRPWGPSDRLTHTSRSTLSDALGCFPPVFLFQSNSQPHSRDDPGNKSCNQQIFSGAGESENLGTSLPYAPLATPFPFRSSR
jgi:hypothetical protein